MTQRYEAYPNATSWADIEREIMADYAAQQAAQAAVSRSNISTPSYQQETVQRPPTSPMPPPAAGGGRGPAPGDPNALFAAYQAGQITREQLVDAIAALNVWAGVPADTARSQAEALVNLQLQPDPGASSQAGPPTADDLIRQFRSSPGAEADRTRLYQGLRNLGVSADDALARMNSEVAAKSGGGAGAGNVPPAVVTNVPPPPNVFVSPEERRRQELSAGRQGRGQLFEEFLATQPPAHELTRRQQREAFAPYQNLYEIGRGFGDIGNERSFDRYLSAGFTGRPDPSYYRGQLERVAGLLEGGEPANAITADFLEKLRKDTGRQAGYVYEGLEPGVPFEFREGVKRIGGERYTRAGDIQDIQRGLGQTQGVNPFRDYLNLGTSFAGPDAGSYRSNVDATADFLSRMGTGERDVQAAFRKQLGEDQPRQFGLALESQRRDIPWELRDEWEDLARESFNRWSSRAPAGDQFLPYIRSRGYQFAGAGR